MIGERLRLLGLLKSLRAEGLSSTESEPSTKTARIDESLHDSSSVYLKEYDKRIHINHAIGWPRPDEFKAMIISSNPSELMADMQQTNGTIGVVMSLLLSMTFLRSGSDFNVHKDNMWGENVELGQSILTFILALMMILCICVILFTTRIYFVLSMLPADSGRLATCLLGGSMLLSYNCFTFLAFAIFSAAVIVLWVSIVLGSVTATILIVVIIVLVYLQLQMCGFNRWWPGGNVDMRFERVLYIVAEKMGFRVQGTPDDIHKFIANMNKTTTNQNKEAEIPFSIFEKGH